jgi:hypothetical protein
MNPLKPIAGFVRWLWSLSMAVRHPIDSGLRPGSGGAGLYMFLFLLFLSIGLVLMALGFDLADVDRWLEANGGWIGGGADLLFRGFMGLIFLFSLLAAGVMLFELGRTLFGARDEALDGPAEQLERDGSGEDDAPPGPLGLGCGVLVALVFAWFAWFGVSG